MFYQKKGFPEESEIVLCTVTKIQYGSIFVTLDEYGNKTGIINIAEISPGRIRNIRDFVQEGKKSICKVLRVDEQRGHIDLSLRRVTESQRRAKNDFIKHEQKAEKIIELISKEVKKPAKEIYDRIMACGYQSLYGCFEDVSVDKISMDKAGLDKDVAAKLTEMIKLKIKPQEIIIEGSLCLESYAPNGLGIVKDALKKAKAKNIILKYVGGGKYMIKVISDDFKKAEEMLEKSANAAVAFVQGNGGTGSFQRLKAEKSQ